MQKRLLENRKSLPVKVRIDSGGGFLKISISGFDMDNLISDSKVGLSKKFKDSGVKKVFLVTAVPDVLENYQNVKKLWLNLGMQNIHRRFTIATDLKYSSCHLCCWCDVEKSDLQKKGTQRTIASLNSLFWDYFEANTSKRKAKHYGNVIQLPIVSSNLDNNTPVTEVLPQPDLHLLIGPVNTLYDGLEKVWPRSEDWLNLCNVKKVEYHGGKFAGNNGRALLKKADQHEGLCPSNNSEKSCECLQGLE